MEGNLKESNLLVQGENIRKVLSHIENPVETVNTMFVGTTYTEIKQLSIDGKAHFSPWRSQQFGYLAFKPDPQFYQQKKYLAFDSAAEDAYYVSALEEFDKNLAKVLPFDRLRQIFYEFPSELLHTTLQEDLKYKSTRSYQFILQQLRKYADCGSEILEQAIEQARVVFERQEGAVMYMHGSSYAIDYDPETDIGIRHLNFKIPISRITGILPLGERVIDKFV